MRPAREVRRGVTTTYHTFSRTVNGQFFFRPHEREFFRNWTRRLAKFLRIKIHTFAVLSNHFHLILKVPGRVSLSDHQLLKALRRFYGPGHRKSVDFAQALRSNSPLLPLLRQRYLGRMGDLSIFMKELKQAMAKWFNTRNDRFGPFWAERFGSVFTGEAPWMILLFCAYVDLNPFRAGQGDDPKDYRWCGYAEALARAGPAREGLASLLPGKNWQEKLAHYRMLLFGKGSWAKNDQLPHFDLEKALEVYKDKGHLPAEELLRLKVKHFTQGVAFGSEESVKGVFEEFRRKRYKRRKKACWPVVKVGGKVLMCLRKFKEGIQLPKKLPPE